MNTNRIIYGALCIITVAEAAAAFQQPCSSYSMISPRSVTGTHMNERRDDAPNEDGAQLASEFNSYLEKLQKMEDKLLQDDNNIDSNSNSNTSEDQKIMPPQPQKKWSGQQNTQSSRFFSSTATPSSSSFPGQSSQSLFSPQPSLPPSNTDPTSRMMQNEFNLVSRAGSETSLILQGILTLVFLGFILMVGMNGGIDNESERFANNGGYDLMQEGFNVADYLESIRTDGSDIAAEEAARAAAAAAASASGEAAAVASGEGSVFI